MDPYRDALVREKARSLVAEPERPPRGVRVRAWNDGTTELRLSSGHRLRDTVLAAGALVLGAMRAARRMWRVQRAVVARDSHLVAGDRLGYDTPTVEWIARRRQRALEDAT